MDRITVLRAGTYHRREEYKDLLLQKSPPSASHSARQRKRNGYSDVRPDSREVYEHQPVTVFNGRSDTAAHSASRDAARSWRGHSGSCPLHPAPSLVLRSAIPFG